MEALRVNWRFVSTPDRGNDWPRNFLVNNNIYKLNLLNTVMTIN